MRTVALGMAALMALAGAANAATVNFSSGTTTFNTSLDFGDFTVTPSATGIGNQGADFVSQGQYGLGVLGLGRPDYSSGSAVPDAQLIDGRPSGSAESLTFTFDTAVTLDSFLLSLFEDDDDYTYSINGGAAVAGNTAFNALGATGVTTFSIMASGTALQDGVLGNDEFGFLEFNYSVAAVPVPASLGLLGVALGALGAARRRRAAGSSQPN